MDQNPKSQLDVLKLKLNLTLNLWEENSSASAGFTSRGGATQAQTILLLVSFLVKINERNKLDGFPAVERREEEGEEEKEEDAPLLLT